MSSHTGSTESAETALQHAHKHASGNLRNEKRERERERRKYSLTFQTELLICTAADAGVHISAATFHDNDNVLTWFGAAISLVNRTRPASQASHVRKFHSKDAELKNRVSPVISCQRPQGSEERVTHQFL